MHSKAPKSPTRPDMADVLGDELTAVDVEQLLEKFDETLASRPTEAPIETTTRHTTIRIPADVLNAFRAEATRRGMPYQTLMIDVLRQHLAATQN